jgi:hypothetical protein
MRVTSSQHHRCRSCPRGAFDEQPCSAGRASPELIASVASNHETFTHDTADRLCDGHRRSYAVSSATQVQTSRDNFDGVSGVTFAIVPKTCSSPSGVTPMPPSVTLRGRNSGKRRRVERPRAPARRRKDGPSSTDPAARMSDRFSCGRFASPDRNSRPTSKEPTAKAVRHCCRQRDASFSAIERARVMQPNAQVI